MISNLKKLAMGVAATAGLLFSQAGLAGLMEVNLGGFNCVDNTACDVNPGLNVMTVIAGAGGVPVIAGYTVVVSTSFSNNPGSPGFNILDITWTVSSVGDVGSAIPLVIEVSQTGFLFPIGPGAILQSVCSGDVLGGSVSCQEWVDLQNVIFGTAGAITPGLHGPFVAPFTDTLFSAAYNSTVPYSMTDRLIFILGPNGTSTGNLRSITPVPEPATLALVGAALAGLGFLRRRKAS